MQEENAADMGLNIELSEDVAEGTYSNLAIIAHSNAEFILDFIKVVPGMPKARVKSRIIMTPQHTKRLLLALQDNVGKFEQLFGEIPLHEQHNIEGMPPLSFGGPGGMA